MEKDKLEFKDDFIESIAKKATRKVLNENFENLLMSNIQKTYTYKKDVSSKLKKSMLYFFLGILVIGIYTLILIIDKSVVSRFINILSILTLFFSIIIAIVFMDNYKRLFKSMHFDDFSRKQIR